MAQSVAAQFEIEEKQSRPDIKIGFVLLNRFTLHPVAELIDPIRFAADVAFSSRQIFCQWEWMTLNNQPVISSCGLPVQPTAPLDFATHWDYVVFAGGLLEETRNPTDTLLDAVRSLHARKIPIITLDSSSFVVAKAGLLDGKRCAVHFTTRDEFKQSFPKVTPVLDQTYISDGGIISCPGGTSIELAVDIIRKHCGEQRASKALKYLMAEPDKPKKPVQKRYKISTINPRYEEDIVQRTIDYMHQHIASPAPLQDITTLMNVSMHQLNQAFLRSTGDTVVVHWRKLRLDHARNLMTNSTASIHEIALRSGFSGASHLITWFRKQYGETPAGFRKRRRAVERLFSPDE
ncbi:GlxA family transcriptional regulator [Candidatus Pantoea multigeneris]|uniref:Helix-turn-helix domain-containing protein n=1 Tax=Candidatus Pantoea multigeneris TaxID=2608357 RepID=A0ABX0R656_9GAMM|nr:helix-turn-helix domain-containing protein [Pantoea multigeneris]NIF20881.1 helix-turn-helix domain-containing protein [Pantoea multigeneris]